MITKIEEGMRGCTKCGKPYLNPFSKGIYINKCADCSDIGHPTPEIKNALMPMLQTSTMTWKKLVRAMRKHKVRFEELTALVGNNKDACSRCGYLLVGMPHFDHDHACCPTTPTCGKCLRGIICARCNLMMAGYDDYMKNPAETERYLSNYRKQREKKK